MLKLRTKFVVRNGAAPREILGHAHENNIDLIVLGTQDRTGLAHLTLGSVAEKVLRSAECPVLAIRQPVQSNAVASANADENSDSHLAAEQTNDATPAVDLLKRAVSVRATDVHLDPWHDDEYLVRFRIDGRLEKHEPSQTVREDLHSHTTRKV